MDVDDPDHDADRNNTYCLISVMIGMIITAKNTSNNYSYCKR